MGDYIFSNNNDSFNFSLCDLSFFFLKLKPSWIQSLVSKNGSIFIPFFFGVKLKPSRLVGMFWEIVL